MRIFRETVFSQLRGGWALKFLHALEIDQGYLAHTQIGTGVLPQKFNRENLKFGLKFSVYTSIISELTGISSHFYPDDVPQARGYNVGTIFGRSAP